MKVGLIIAAIGWIFGKLGIDLGLTDDDRELIGDLVMGFGGGLATAGRFITGLKPMSWNPLTWFGLKN